MKGRRLGKRFRMYGPSPTRIVNDLRGYYNTSPEAIPANTDPSESRSNPNPTGEPMPHPSQPYESTRGSACFLVLDKAEC